MGEMKELQIYYLLDDSVKKSGAELTKLIGQLGDGRMVNGLRALWVDGHRSGYAEGCTVTAITFIAGIGVYNLAKCVMDKWTMRRAMEEFFDDLQERDSVVRTQNKHEEEFAFVDEQ